MILSADLSRVSDHQAVHPAQEQAVVVLGAGPGEGGAATAGRMRPGSWAFPLLTTLLVGLLWLIHVVAPRFFWFDDAQIQFTPMNWWLGRQLGEGSVPLLDPDQGMAGNLTADMQNGVLDPVRWPFMWWAGGQEDLLLVATAQGWSSVLVLGWASLALLLNHGVRPALAVGSGVGVATSGFFLWWATAWSPSMWSLAALVWLWASLTSRRWYGVPAAGLACGAVVCAGNPYILPLVPALLVAQLYERWRVDGPVVLRQRRTWATLVALAGATAISLPTLVNAVDVSAWMWRLPADETIGASGGGTNLMDVVLGGTTLLNSPNIPMFSTSVIALPLLAFTDWSRARLRPGVVTAAVLWVIAVLWTQLPYYFWGLRIPFRQLSAVQVSFGLLAVLAFSAAMVVSRRRLGVAIGLVLLQSALAVMRAGVLWRWHLLALGVALAATVAVVALVRPGVLRLPVPVRGVVPSTAAVAVVLVCTTPIVIQLGLQRTVQERYEVLVGGSDTGAPVYRPHSNGYRVGTTVEEFRAQSLLTDTAVTAYAFAAFGDGNDRGWSRGILGGNMNLFAGLRPGFGSLAVWPRGVQQYIKADYQSGLGGDQPGLLVVPEGSDRPWVDLLSSDRVLLGANDGTGQFVPQAITDYFEQNWDRVATENGWTEYVRPQPLPGRVTLMAGRDLEVSDAAPNDGVATLGGALERYTVSTGDDGGRLVFRTPYWNGFRATVDGRPVEVSPFADAVLQVELPADLSAAELEITFDPIGARILPASFGTAAVLLVLAAVLAVRGPRRPVGRDAVAGTSSHGGPEPARTAAAG